MVQGVMSSQQEAPSPEGIAIEQLLDMANQIAEEMEAQGEPVPEGIQKILNGEITSPDEIIAILTPYLEGEMAGEEKEAKKMQQEAEAEAAQEMAASPSGGGRGGALSEYENVAPSKDPLMESSPAALRRAGVM